METLTLVLFPNQLFESAPRDIGATRVYVLQDPLFFGDASRVAEFHPHKITLHKKSIAAYKKACKVPCSTKGYPPGTSHRACYDEMWSALGRPDTLHMLHVYDRLLETRLRAWSTRNRVDIVWHDNPGFLFTHHEREEYKGAYLFSSFFAKGKKQWKIHELFPSSTDKQNRKRPDRAAMDELASMNMKRFSYPVTRDEALALLREFLTSKIHRYGDLQDFTFTSPRLQADPFAFHSGLSSSLNIGIITPHEVLQAVLKHMKQQQGTAPHNSYEGFVRQLFWREYVLLLYQHHYEHYINDYQNFRSNQTRLDKRGPWYDLKKADALKSQPVVYHAVTKTLTHSYAHHIERLMVLLNFMMISGIHPESIYHWFTSQFIDAYDWVMIPNIYGMGYFSTTGMRKPYVSSSSYVARMSDVPKDGTWDKEWDRLFYGFLHDNRDTFKKTVYANLLKKRGAS